MQSYVQLSYGYASANIYTGHWQLIEILQTQSERIGCRKHGVSMLKIDLSAFPLYVDIKCWQDALHANSSVAS
jgi:hypothetical protein